jgi:multidrug efflux system membrane fusion protein
MNSFVKQWIDRLPEKQRPWLLGAVGLVAVYLAWRLVSWALGPHGPPPETAMPVVVATATAGDVPLYLEGIGTVRAANTVTVRSRVDGQLVEVSFREGQTVRQGDVIAQIDPRPFQAMLDNAMGNLARDQSSLENAKRDLMRSQELAKSGYAAQQRVDTQAATANSLAAAVRSDEAAVRNAHVQLGYATIKAPIDGRTGIRQIDAGNIIHASDPNGLVVITQVQPITAIFTLPQKDLARVVAAGDPTSLKVTALNSESTTELDTGTLELIDNTIDPATGSVKLKASFPNTRQALWPGQFVNIRLQVGVAKSGVTVPSRAVQRGPKGPYAYVIKDDERAELRQLETGQEHDDRILVSKGLNAADRVVTDGALGLKAGTKVRATDGEKTEAAARDAATQGTVK